MEDWYTDIIFFEALTPERRKAIRAAMSEDPELTRSFVRWRQVRAAVRSQIAACVPDRQLLVLYALDEAGQGGVLSGEERAALAEVRHDIEAAIEAHPGLGDVVERIQEEQRVFDAVWEAHVAQQPAPARDAMPARPDRTRQDRDPRPARAQRTASVYRQWGGRIAAAALVVAAAVLSVMLLSEDNGQTVVATGEGDVRAVALGDGSTVRLMANSRLAYTLPDANEPFDRTVTLDAGRAFFDVATASRRFVVETPTARTIVLGTSFGVQVRSGETQVVLASGRVTVAARDDTARAVTLQPGQASRVASDATPTAPASVDITDALDWTGLFIFRETPISTIVERLARHYQTTVTVAPALQDQAVTGTFERQRALAPILETIATTLEARVERTDDGYRIQPVRDVP